MYCNICDAQSVFYAEATILQKYRVQYFCCPNCGFVQTEEPFWLDEAYAEAITRTDIGIVQRNLMSAKFAKAFILTFFDANARFVDYGGGYGLLVRLMRDNGFDFYRWDKYCPNLFAQSFDASSNQVFELLTAIEVFEHFVHPLENIQQMFSLSHNILFTTLPISSPPPSIEKWWYYGLEHGQHIAFYTRKSLEIIAKQMGMHLNSHGYWHLFSKHKIPSFCFRLISNYWMAIVAARLLRGKLQRRSLLSDDYLALTGKQLL